MSESAEKVEEQDVPETPAEQAEDQGADGFDVVGDDSTPESDAVPLPTFLKQKEKWKKRAQSAKRDADALLAENELLKMQLEQASSKRKPSGMPKAEDFDSSEDHAKAMQKWVVDQTRQAAKEVVGKPAAPQQHRQVDDDKLLRAHYERAAKLKASDFEERENTVIETLGQDAAGQIVALFDNSEAVMYALGGNSRKLGELREQLDSNPVQAVVNLTKYASGLRLQPRNKAPEPDPAEKASGSAANLQAQLDRLRDQVASGTKTMRDVLAFKAEARAKGANLI